MTSTCLKPDSSEFGLHSLPQTARNAEFCHCIFRRHELRNIPKYPSTLDSGKGRPRGLKSVLTATGRRAQELPGGFGVSGLRASVLQVYGSWPKAGSSPTHRRSSQMNTLRQCLMVFKNDVGSRRLDAIRNICGNLLVRHASETRKPAVVASNPHSLPPFRKHVDFAPDLWNRPAFHDVTVR